MHKIPFCVSAIVLSALSGPNSDGYKVLHTAKRHAIYRSQSRAHNRDINADPRMTSSHKEEQKKSKNLSAGLRACAKLLKFQRGPVAQLDRAPVS
jgi:hypothetical protein